MHVESFNGKGEKMIMFTISDILQDINRHCAIYNMIENKFSYRLVYFINAENGSEKHCIDVQYDGLRIALENTIRGNLTVTNNIVIAAVTVRKKGEVISLLGRSYGFSLEEYFCQIYGKGKKRDNTCNKYASALYGN